LSGGLKYRLLGIEKPKMDTNVFNDADAYTDALLYSEHEEVERTPRSPRSRKM
jgi:hypothetical protein